MSTKLQTVIKYCVVLIVIVHWTACALKLVTEYTLNECDYEDCPQTILTSTSNYRDGIWAQYVEAAVWALVAINGEASTRTHGEGVLGLLVMLCVEITSSRRVHGARHTGPNGLFSKKETTLMDVRWTRAASMA